VGRPGRVAAALGLALALAAGACGQRPASFGGEATNTVITFSISVSDEERPAIRELVRRFQDRTKAKVDLELLSRFRSQPASRIDVVTSLDAEQLTRRLEADVADGTPSIHLFAQDNLALKDLVDGQLVADLSSVEIPGAVVASMIPPRFDGRQLFLPFRPNVRVAYADRRLLDQVGADAPTTVEELTSVARRLQAAAGRPAVTLSLAEGDPAAVTVSEWIVSFGGDPLLLNDEGSVAAFEWLQRLWQEGLLARESLFAKFDTEVDHLSSGRALLAQNWSFTSAVLAQRDQLRDFEVYAGWSGPERSAHVIGGDVLGIPRGVSGEQKKVALALAAFLMSEEAQEVLVQANAWPPIRADAYDEVPDEQRETFAAIQEALEDGWFRPVVSYWSDVTAAMNEAVDRVLLRDEPAEPVLDELHARVAAAARRDGAPYPP
jgi:trehalose transport system substrate-binding protein